MFENRHYLMADDIGAIKIKFRYQFEALRLY